MSSTIVAFGEILWDLLPSGAVLGGAPFNFVCRIDSLGHRGVMVSRLGRDDLGDRALRRLAAGADCLCFGTLIQRRETSRTTLYRLLEELSGRFVLLDINLRPDCYARRNILESIGRANILKLKDGEAERLVQIYKLPRDLVATEPGVFAETLFACTDLQYIVLTLGERGAFAAPRAPW